MLSARPANQPFVVRLKAPREGATTIRTLLDFGWRRDDRGILIAQVKAAGGDVACFHEDCVWLDIGRPDDFALAQQMFVSDRSLFLAS